MSFLDEIQSPNKEAPIIDHPLLFKAKLDIGPDAYEYLTKAENFLVFSKSIAAGLGGASLAGVGWFATLGPIAKASLLFGFTSTPVGWVAGAGALSAVFAFGLMQTMKKTQKTTVITIPKHLNTPLDVLAQTVLALILPAAVKMALVDGHVCDNERKVLSDYFVKEWGYNSDFIATAITEQESLIADFDYDQYRQFIIGATSTDIEIKYDVISNELLKLLHDVMKVDNQISPEEEKEFIALSDAVRRQGETGTDSVKGTIAASINRTRDKIIGALSKKSPDPECEAGFSQDYLFTKLGLLDEKSLKDLLVSGLRVSVEKVDGLNREELVVLCSKELRSAAGSSIRNLLRDDHAFPYKQILIDVADRLADGFTPLSWTEYRLDDTHTEEEIEETILKVFDERARKWWENQSPEIKQTFADGLNKTLDGENIDDVVNSGGVKTVLTQQIIDNVFQYGVTFGLSKVSAVGLFGALGVSVVGHIGWLLIVQTLGFMTGKIGRAHV